MLDRLIVFNDGRGANDVSISSVGICQLELLIVIGRELHGGIIAGRELDHAAVAVALLAIVIVLAAAWTIAAITNNSNALHQFNLVVGWGKRHSSSRLASVLVVAVGRPSRRAQRRATTIITATARGGARWKWRRTIEPLVLRGSAILLAGSA